MRYFLFFYVILFLFSGCGFKRNYDHLPQTKFLWRVVEFDKKFNIELNTIKLNQAYIDTLREQEKAVIAYLASWIGNDCDWENDNIQRADNLKCKIISALDLGYQCSEQHVGIIKKWFRNDENILSHIADCKIMPRTATSLSGFYYINLARTGNLFIVSYDGFGVGTSNHIGFEWSAEVVFEIREDEVILVDFNESSIHEAEIDLELFGQVHIEHPYKTEDDN